MRPVKKGSYFVFKYFVLPLYNFFYLFKKWLKGYSHKQPTNKVALIFTHKNLLYILIFVLSLAVLENNSKIKSLAAEDLGNKSLLYKIAQGDEFEEIIEEAPLTSESNNKNHLNNKEINFLEPTETAITRNEPVAKQLSTTTLQEVATAEGLAADTLQKSGAPSTFTSPQPREKIHYYTVQAGDTISSIAKKFNISINTILWANDLSGLSIIRPGDKLTILPVSGVLHKVKKGDTISKIAKQYSVSQDKVLAYNRLVNEKQLSIGQLLVIPDGKIKKTYVRRTGTLSSIFRKPSSQRKSTGFIWPTTSRRITQYYHWRHHAIDIGGRTGSPIYASMSGKIIRARWGRGYGYHIIIDHGAGKKTLYAHLSKIYVKVGEQISQGTVIGALGSTGWSTGPHLHFEIIINGRKVNPLSYL